MVPVQRPEGAGDALVAIDATSGAGGLPLDAAQADVYYFAPQKCFASDGGLWLALLSPAAQERIGEIAALRPLDPGLPEPADRTREQRQGPDVQHAGARDADHARRAARLDERAGRSRLLRRAHDRRPRTISTRGPKPRPTRRRSSAIPAKRSLVVGTIDFDDSVDAAVVAATLRANGVVDVEPYRKLGRNQLRVGDVPGDRTGRRAGTDGLHRLDRRPSSRRPRHDEACSSPRTSAIRGSRCCATPASRSRPASTGRARSCSSGSAATTAS